MDHPNNYCFTYLHVYVLLFIRLIYLVKLFLIIFERNFVVLFSTVKQCNMTDPTFVSLIKVQNVVYS